MFKWESLKTQVPCTQCPLWSMGGGRWVKLGAFSCREQVMADGIKELDKLSLRDFSQFYKDLVVGDTAVLQGVYRGMYVGPGWLKTAGPRVISLRGLSGWWGKLFQADGEAFNLVERDGRIEPIFPMRLESITSKLDSAPALALIYDAGNPFPWPNIVDELRPLDETAVLGMTYFNVDAVPKIAFPFLIQKIEKDTESAEKAQRAERI